MPVSASDKPVLVVFGAGGHGRVAADAALASGAFARVVASDHNPATWTGELLPGADDTEFMRLLDGVDRVLSGICQTNHLGAGRLGLQEIRRIVGRGQRYVRSTENLAAKRGDHV